MAKNKLELRKGEQTKLAELAGMLPQQMNIYITKKKFPGYQVAVRLEAAVKELGIKGFTFEDFMKGDY